MSDLPFYKGLPELVKNNRSLKKDLWKFNKTEKLFFDESPNYFF